MGLEDYTTYTEVDGANRYVVTKNKIAVTAIDRGDPNQHVTFDCGVDCFDGDFNHEVEFVVTVSGGVFVVWALANVTDGVIPIADILWLDYFNNQLRLIERVGGSLASDNSITLSLSTKYYLSINRDESIGSFGQLQCLIYSNASRTTLVDTLTLALRSKADWRYVYGTAGYESGSGASTGDIENLNLEGGVILITVFSHVALSVYDKQFNAFKEINGKNTII